MSSPNIGLREGVDFKKNGFRFVDFIVSQSPNLWIFRLETLDLYFLLDNIS